MRSHIFGTLVGVLSQSTRNLPWSLWRIRGDVWNTGNATPDLVWPKTPWDRYGRILESPSPQLRKQCGICCLKLFLLCTLLPIAIVFLTVKRFAFLPFFPTPMCHSGLRSWYTLPETNIFAPENRPGSNRIYASSKHSILQLLLLMRFRNPKHPKPAPPGMVLKNLVNQWDVKLPNSSTGELCQIHRAESSGRGVQAQIGGIKYQGRNWRWSFWFPMVRKGWWKTSLVRQRYFMLFLIVYLLKFYISMYWFTVWKGGAALQFVSSWEWHVDGNLWKLIVLRILQIVLNSNHVNQHQIQYPRKSKSTKLCPSIVEKSSKWIILKTCTLFGRLDFQGTYFWYLFTIR